MQVSIYVQVEYNAFYSIMQKGALFTVCACLCIKSVISPSNAIFLLAHGM